MEIEKRLESVGLTHFSASQLNKPVANWLFESAYLSNEERRNIIVGEAAAFGTSVHKGIQDILCSGVDAEDAIKDALFEFDFHQANKSEEKRVKYREVLPDAIHSGVNLLSEEFTGAEEERRVELNLDGVLLPIIGYVDLCVEGRFAEVKTKAPRPSRIKADGTRGWSKGLIPKEPTWSHVLQAAIYAKATGFRPCIAYVSAEGGTVFTPENTEKLSDESLSYAIEEVRRKAILRQNLLGVSEDVRVLAGLIEPDWTSFFWNEEHLQEAKELWKV